MPSEQQLEALITEARATNSSALVIIQDGKTMVNEVLDGQGEQPIETMSVTKAVISLLVGRAVTLGHIPDRETPIYEFYPEWRQGRKKDVTLKHLLTHTSGLQNVPMAPAEIYPSPDFVQLALCAELDNAPGEKFEYNNKAVNLICGVLERATGQKADDFARTELFGPLGIEDFHWVRDPAGNPHGMSGLRLRPRDLARLGELTLNDGEGLISSDWIRESTHPATPAFKRIGLLWWMWHESMTYTVTPEHVQNLREANAKAAHLQALEQMIGEHDRTELGKLMGQHDFRPPDLPARTRWCAEHLGPRIGYMHDGWLGQYLCIHEFTRTVAVRLIASDHPKAQDEESGWPDFSERLVEFLNKPRPAHARKTETLK